MTVVDNSMQRPSNSCVGYVMVHPIIPVLLKVIQRIILVVKQN